MGVTKLPNQKYRARYSKNGQRVNLGTFKTHGEAKAALEQARNPVLQNEPTPYIPDETKQVYHVTNQDPQQRKSIKQKLLSWLRRNQN